MNVHLHMPHPHFDELLCLVLVAGAVLTLMFLMAFNASRTPHPRLEIPTTIQTSPGLVPGMTAPGTGAYPLVPGGRSTDPK